MITDNGFSEANAPGRETIINFSSGTNLIVIPKARKGKSQLCFKEKYPQKRHQLASVFTILLSKTPGAVYVRIRLLMNEKDGGKNGKRLHEEFVARLDESL